MNKKKLRPYHGIIAVVLTALFIFLVNPLLFGGMGLFGTLFGELAFLLLALLITAAARADFKEVFPIRKPHGFTLLGMLFMWGAVFVSALAVSVLLSYFFPQEVYAAGAGLSQELMNSSLLAGIIIVSIAPAVCEEAIFRGVLLNSLSGMKRKWLVIIIVGCIFGAFHGSVWKFIPTAALGMLMTYLVLETHNMVYSALLHLVNNLVPVLLLFCLQFFMQSAGGYSEALSEASQMQIPLASVAVYLLIAAAAPFVFYIGRYFVRRGERGYEGEIFRRDNRKALVILIVLTAVLVVSGILLFLVSFMVDQQYLQDIMQKSNSISQGFSL